MKSGSLGELSTTGKPYGLAPGLRRPIVKSGSLGEQSTTGKPYGLAIGLGNLNEKSDSWREMLTTGKPYGLASGLTLKSRSWGEMSTSGTCQKSMLLADVGLLLTMDVLSPGRRGGEVFIVTEGMMIFVA